MHRKEPIQDTEYPWKKGCCLHTVQGTPSIVSSQSIALQDYFLCKIKYCKYDGSGHKHVSRIAIYKAYVYIASVGRIGTFAFGLDGILQSRCFVKEVKRGR